MGLLDTQKGRCDGRGGSGKRIGILTGGGDSPGLNAAIRGATLAAIRKYDMEVVGFIDGFNGIFEGDDGYRILTEDDVQAIHSYGGTILGTANRGNPFKMVLRDSKGRPRRDDAGEVMTRDRSQEAVDRLKELKLEGLICIGGDGTLSMAYDFFKLHGVPVVGVPKTIDFDLACTEATFGFKTAVQVASDALDRLRTTADSHDRVLILEVMGRYAGWIAMHAGLAGGAHAILLPEIPYDARAVWDRVTNRFRKSRHFSLVVISEGAHPVDGTHAVTGTREHPDGHVMLGGAGHRLRAELEALYAAESDEIVSAGGNPPESPEVRVVVLGHIQRGGTPLADDRIIATACGAYAVDLAHEGNFGSMSAWASNAPVAVDLNDAIQSHFVDPNNTALLDVCRAVGICLGEPEADDD